MNSHRRRFLRNSLLVAGAATASQCAAGPAQRRARIIDAHSHAGRGLNYGRNDPSADPWTTYNDPRLLLRKAAEVGIEQSVVFPINNITYAKANEEIASYVRQWPGRFIGFAKHDPKSEAGQIRTLLTREIHELGLRGLKLHAVPSPEMMEVVTELRIPILMHPPRVADSLEVVRAHPQVNFLLAHLGSFASHDWKEHRRAIDAAKALPNLYLETSSVVFFDYLELAARELPPEKIVFGSDGPLVDMRVELHKIRLLRLGADAEAKVLSGNIRRLLGL
jgi:predicted TIM-barrel fold metal-dependent hydrolase